jgi:hypothetical protein
MVNPTVDHKVMATPTVDHKAMATLTVDYHQDMETPIVDNHQVLARTYQCTLHTLVGKGPEKRRWRTLLAQVPHDQGLYSRTNRITRNTL